MGIGYKVSQLYDDAVHKAVKGAEEWKSVCRLAGQLYRYEFDNILMIYMQRPQATLVADYDTWKKVGRYVKRGSRGIAIFPSRALRPEMRHVFDISDTGGRDSRLTWKLDEAGKKAYAGYLRAEGIWEEKAEDAGKREKEPESNFLKAFTESRIRSTIELEFGNRVAELADMAGTKRIKVDDETQEVTAGEAVERSALYAVFTRCGFDLPPEKQDFSFITAFTSEEEVYRLGSLVSDISCEVLGNIAKDLERIKGRRIAYGRDGIDVPRGNGRDALPRPGNAGGGGLHDGPGKVRNQGGGVPGGELQRPLPDAGEVREDAGSGRGSGPDDGDTRSRLSEEQPAEGTGIHDGDVAVKGTGEDAGRGSGDGGHRDEVPLEDSGAGERRRQPEKEIGRELGEASPAGTVREGSYEQASFSFAPNGDIVIPEKYTYTKPKREAVVPHGYVRQALLMGSSKTNGKQGIYRIFGNIPDEGERARRIKEEYGQGGYGWDIEGHGLHGYDAYHGNGLRFLWRDEEGEKEGFLSWEAVEREIGALILAGEYYQPPRAHDAGRVPDTAWQECLRQYFNEEAQHIPVKALIYDIFTTNLGMGAKAGFLKNVYGQQRDGSPMAEKISGPYGESLITRDGEGITVSYVKADGTKGEHKVDYAYCTSLVMRMIEESGYLSEEILQRSQESLQDSMGMPWVMDIYRRYQEKMKTEPDFAAISLQGEELPEGSALETAHGEETGHVEGDILDADGTVIMEGNKPTFPDALQQVEGMDEDLREALEAYLLRCSDFRASQPLLQMVHGSGLPKEDRLYFLNRAVNHLEDEGETRSYCNNAYGLVEYTHTKDAFSADFKDREGERRQAAVTYEQLYSIMEYLIQAGTFSERNRQAGFADGFAQRSYDARSPLEREFVDKMSGPEGGHPPGSFRFRGELPRGGQKARYQWNVEAIRLLKKIEGEGRAATGKEQEVLARYVGWGGIPQAFDGRNEGWRKEYEELKSLLTGTEYENARDSVNTAFYTDPAISSVIYGALEKFGFKGGSILEPALGVGHFFGTLPESLAGSRLYGVEKDSISGRIAKLLYPEAEISIKGFEEKQYPDHFFDVAVGNVPFGDYKLFDPRYAKHNFRIHDYFFAKALDKVRPSGIMAFVTSKGTLDKANPAVRRYLAERAELLGAIRLPDTAFRGSAGTDVTSDIIFLQKRDKKTVAEPDWVHLGQTEDGIAVNSYFARHPEMMLGKMEYDSRMFGDGSRYTSCTNHDGDFDLASALREAADKLNGRMSGAGRPLDREEASEDIIEADPDVKNFTYTFVEGKLYYREDSKMYRKEMPASVEEKVRLMDGIRKVARKLISIQAEGCSETELRSQQGLLGQKYDDYVKRHGPITGTGSMRAFRDDADYPLLCSLEVVGEDGSVEKADMFYKQTIRPKTMPERVGTAVEALNISVNEFGGVNLPFMLSLYEPDIKKKPGESPSPADAEAEAKRSALVGELAGLIFLDPAEYCCCPFILASNKSD